MSVTSLGVQIFYPYTSTLILDRVSQKRCCVNLLINEEKSFCLYSLEMWTTTEFIIFQKYLFSVLIPIVIVVGNLGSILNIIVFSVSRKLRSSSCSLYLIFASIGFAIYLNIVAVLRYLQVSFNIDPSSQWSWVCKLRFYTVGFLVMLPRSYMLLAAIDR